ncbi:SEC-C domain-containing protein [Clostridioides difficile]|nr:SEC-C domain-containing protein [Clostridioides difficile]MBY2131251.1 SEC-C domain-containing protein [Clostridioides difficile]MBZ0622718.1 SEC-C domain-containing protein [Clostridioides difficile]MCI2311646.1 SEC-C domain-containing protein [Clostridioides difficile]MCR1428781.1 SEC-C domain-containing protein [Clostridioides difficile]
MGEIKIFCKHFKFSKSEECPCGSGKTFGQCCYLKEARTFHNENEVLSIIAKNSRKSRINLCLYPECKTKAIGAHAIQENGILSKLAIDKYVWKQNKKENPELLEAMKNEKEPFCFLSKVLIKNATVQTCFCEKHDNKLFEDIEKSDRIFSPNNLKQLFLFTYRTFSFEYYTEIMSNKFYTNMFKDIPQLTKEASIVFNYRESLNKKEEMNYYKSNFDEIIINERYSELATLVIEFPYEFKFANYMSIAPNFDLMGNKLRVYDNKSKMMRRIFVTSFSKDEKSYILISVLKKDFKIYEKYLKSFEQVSQEVIKYYFNAVIPLMSENLIISPELWDEWDDKGKSLVQVAVNDINPRNFLRYLKLILHKLHKKNNSDFSLENCNYNIFGKNNLNAEIKIIKN